MTVFDDEVRQRLLDWDKSGYLTVKEQARRLGVTTKTASRWRHDLGIAKPRRISPPITPELDARIKSMFAEGMGRTGVSEATGVSLEMLTKRYPGMRMDRQEVGSLGAAVRNFNRGAMRPRTPSATGV